jgi:predicted PurR-regulated permease PerM
MNKSLSRPFLILLVILVLVACYLVFRPFITEILVAAILVSIFYRPYLWLAKKLGNRRNLASFLMCVLVLLIIIIPVVNLIIYTGQKSIIAYQDTVQFLENNDLQKVADMKFLERFHLSEYLQDNSIKDFVISTIKKSSNWLMSGATAFVKGTTSFIFSLIMIIFAMFFFFVDGKKIVQGLMRLSPLPNKYDKEIFKKFREVSYITIVSTFVTAIGQGLVAAIGFLITGFPAFFPSLLIALACLIPYIGAGLVYVPVGIYLILVGQIWQGIFIIIWGFTVVAMSDNIIRAYMIKGKAQVNPVFIIFAILGGIALFGFWGVIIGPLVISVAVTIFHIYELEFDKLLDREE